MIPNYNGASLLQTYLPFAIEALQQLDLTGELVVSDDASSDDSCSLIGKLFPDVILVKGERNLGFAGNCNRGVAACKGDFVLILNSDVRLSVDYLKKLLPYTSRADIFSLGGSIFPDGPGEMSDGGKYPVWKGSMLNSTVNFEAMPGTGDAFPCLFNSGAAVLVDRKKFSEMGGFKELFNPYYFEDADLGIHAWRLGWKSLYIPDAICFHQISSTIGKEEKREQVRITARRNKLLLHGIHLSGGRRYWWKFLLFFQSIQGLIRPNSLSYRAYREYLFRKEGAEKHRMELEKVPGIRTLDEVVSGICRELQGKVKRLF
jgi:GT2 family glycosyltransferase